MRKRGGEEWEERDMLVEGGGVFDLFDGRWEIGRKRKRKRRVWKKL